jgi:hypothetical protein
MSTNRLVSTRVAFQTILRRPLRRRLLCVCVAAALWALPGQVAHAAVPWQRPGAQPQGAQPVDAEGSVLAVQGNAISMTTSTNQTMLVGITPMTSVRVTGTATPEALRAPMCVEFVGEVDKKGTVKDKITRLAIFTPKAGRQLGLFPEADAFQSAPAATDTKEKPAAIKLPATCTVRGKVKTFHAGSLSVTAGKLNVKAELDDSATIEIDLSDVSLVAHGDKIAVKGQAGRPGLVRAESVTIELAQPLTGKKRAAKPAKPAKKAKAGEPAEKEEPAEAKTGDNAEPAPEAKTDDGDGDTKAKPKPKSKPKIKPAADADSPFGQ